jgi:DNA polymerase-3 subunit epsilon
MSFLARLLRRGPPLDARLAERIAAWRRLRPESKRAALERSRWVVVDVETTGLDPRRDRLIAIGAVAVEGPRLVVGRGFEVVLRDPGAKADGAVLVHGIAPTEREQGAPPERALAAFLEFVGGSPLAAFHAPFDRVVLERATRVVLGERMRNRWVDLAWLAPALYPAVGLERLGLDPWLEHFGLVPHARHRALGDALVTGELFLVLLAQARTAGIRDVGGLLRLARAHERVAQQAGGVAGA